MKTSKKKKLQAAGWKVGETTDFLKLTDEEAALIEMKLALANEIRKRRMDENLTQHDLADLIRSSQSRVAKMETGDPSVSLDLLVRCLLALGTSPKRLAKVIQSLARTPARA